jgi:hypothetical protein
VDPPAFNWTEVHPGPGRKKVRQKEKYEANFCLKALDVYFWRLEVSSEAKVFLEWRSKKKYVAFFPKEILIFFSTAHISKFCSSLIWHGPDLGLDKLKRLRNLIQ